MLKQARRLCAVVLMVAYGVTSQALPAGSVPPPIDPEGGPPGQGAADVVVLPATEVTKEIYLAAAHGAGTTELDVLAGATAELVTLTPNASVTDLRATIGGLRTLLVAQAPSASYDLAGTPARRVSRLLARALPLVPAASRAALQAYARRYAAALRAGLDQSRALTRVESLYDQAANYDTFRRDAWARLLDAARHNAALAIVMDEPVSPFFQALGVRTSDPAVAMLAARDLGPLEDFVLANLRDDGAVDATSAQVDELVRVAGVSATALARSYATNLFALNTAEETYLATQAGPITTGDPKATLKAAVDDAEQKTKDLDVDFGKTKAGLVGALGLASSFATLGGHQATAKAIATYSKAVTTLIDSLSSYTKGAIETTRVIDKLTSAGGLAKLIGGAVLTAGLVAVALEVFSIFESGPDPNAKVLERLAEIKDLVKDVQREMRGRFDRIDEKLNRVLDTIVAYFDLVNWEVGETQVHVGEVQAGLYEVQSDVARLERNIYTFMGALSHEPLLTSITGNLNYQQRTGVEMPFTPTFVDAENDFYAWARELSKDELLGGPLQRSFADSALLSELTSFPLATNINYLSQLPQVRFGLAPLSTSRLSNPLDWGVAAESYAQLSEEWPAHAGRIAPFRRGDVQDSGQKLAAALNAISSGALFTKLAEHYQGAFGAVKARIADLEAAYEADPTNRVYGVDLWSGPDQVPSQSFLSRTKDLPACSGRPFGTLPTLPFAFRQADYPGYGALMLGDNLGAGFDSACVAGNWVRINGEPTGFGGWWRFTYRLLVTVRISYSGTAVLEHTFFSSKERSELARETAPPTNPPSETAVGEVWPGLRGFPASVSATSTPEFMASVKAGVSAQLAARQREFYERVAQQCRLAGSPIANATRVLSGSRKLWESYVTLGLPTALEQDDVLRTLLFGSRSVFAGTDLGDDDGLLNDVEDVYAFTAGQPTLPSQNVMLGLDALQAERANTLRDEIQRVRTAMLNAGEYDGEGLVRSTLVRLSVLPPAAAQP